MRPRGCPPKASRRRIRTEYAGRSARSDDHASQHRVDLYVQDNDDEWSSSCDSCYVIAIDVIITSGDTYIRYGGEDSADIYYTISPNDPDIRSSSALVIKDSSQNTIRTIDLGPYLGSQSTSWDGRKDDGSPAPAGTYSAVVRMTVAFGGGTFYSNSYSITVVNVAITDYDPYLGHPPGDWGPEADIYFSITPQSIADSYRVWLVIRDSSQTPIYSLDLGETLGSRWTCWQGHRDDQSLAPAGEYKASIELRIGPGGSFIISASQYILVVYASICPNDDSSPIPVPDWTSPSRLAPGLILPVDLAGDDPPGQDYWEQFVHTSLTPVSSTAHFLCPKGEVSISNSSTLRMRDGSSPSGWFSTSIIYDAGVPAYFEIDGLSPNTAIITIAAKTNEGAVIAQDHMHVLVTDTVSHCPGGTSGTVWRPGTGSGFGGADGDIFASQAGYQGYSVSTIIDDDPTGFGGCTLSAYKSLSSSSALHIMGPPGSPASGHPAVYGTQAACYAWMGTEAMSVVQVEGELYCVLADGDWLEANFAPGLNTTNAIVNWALSRSDSYYGAAGGRWSIGYSASADAGNDYEPTTELLLTRMNGSDGNGMLRTAGEAWGAGQFPSSVSMSGNSWTTLCPAPVEDSPTWPVTLDGDGNHFACIIFDTYMNTSLTNGLVSLPSGSVVGSQYWTVEIGYGKYVLGFEYEIDNGQGHGSVKARTDYIKSGGKEMDGNRRAANGYPPEDDVTWQY